jgi:hypothetical protein
MLELMFAYKSGYYHRLLIVHCIVQPTSWSLDWLLGFSDGGGAPQSVAKGTTNLTLYTREAGVDLLRDYTAVGILRLLSFRDHILVIQASLVGTSYASRNGEAVQPPSCRPLGDAPADARYPYISVQRLF